MIRHRLSGALSLCGLVSLPLVLAYCVVYFAEQQRWLQVLLSALAA